MPSTWQNSRRRLSPPRAERPRPPPSWRCPCSCGCGYAIVVVRRLLLLLQLCSFRTCRSGGRSTNAFVDAILERAAARGQQGLHSAHSAPSRGSAASSKRSTRRCIFGCNPTVGLSADVQYKTIIQRHRFITLSKPTFGPKQRKRNENEHQNVSIGISLLKQFLKKQQWKYFMIGLSIKRTPTWR